MTLFKKQGNRKEDIVDTYFDIINILKNKKDIANMEKQLQAFLDILQDKQEVERVSERLMELFAEISPIVVNASLLPPIAAILQYLLEKNLINEKEFVAVVMLRPSDFQVNPEFMTEVELTDLKEKEVVMGIVTRFDETKAVFERSQANERGLGVQD